LDSAHQKRWKMLSFSNSYALTHQKLISNQLYSSDKMMVHIMKTQIVLCLMIILPNLQDKVSCKYKVQGLHTQGRKLHIYYKMEFGFMGLKNEVEGKGKMLNLAFYFLVVCYLCDAMSDRIILAIAVI